VSICIGQQHISNCWTMLESRVQVLKIDRHKYVKIAYHGFKAMSREDRLNTYSNSDVRLAMRVIWTTPVLSSDGFAWPGPAAHLMSPLAQTGIYIADAIGWAQVRFSFDEPEFAMIDTLFSLAEAHLFMQLVELKEERPDLLPPGKDFATMYRSDHFRCSPILAGLASNYSGRPFTDTVYEPMATCCAKATRCLHTDSCMRTRDVRAAVDLCHRDGSLKQLVAADPERYVHPDLRLGPTLEMLRAAGKKLFLATNSQWDYTSVVMNFLLTGRTWRLLCVLLGCACHPAWRLGTAGASAQSVVCCLCCRADQQGAK
jgi:5' nucleotidase family